MLYHVRAPGTLAFHLLTTVHRKKISSANVWAHNVGLAPLLLLLRKRSRQLVPFENEKVYRE